MCGFSVCVLNSKLFEKQINFLDCSVININTVKFPKVTHKGNKEYFKDESFTVVDSCMCF